MTRKWRLILLVSLIGNLTIVYVGYKAWSYRTDINYWLDKYLYVVDEFSGSDVYRSANSGLNSDTIVPGRIVFLGTQAVNDWPLDEFFPDFEAIDRGIIGQRAAGFLLRFRQDVVALRPEYVLIEISSYNFRPNTRAGEIYDYLVSMAELAEFHNIKPILTTAFPPQSTFVVKDHPDYNVADTVAAYNNRLTAYARENKIMLADWYAALVDSDGNLRGDLAVSKIDLNQSGYEVISGAVRAAIASAEPSTSMKNHQPENK
jgi:lysophospholipase L1-like esterase